MSRHQKPAGTPELKLKPAKPLSYCKQILAQHNASQRTNDADLIQSWGAHKTNISFKI